VKNGESTGGNDPPGTAHRALAFLIVSLSYLCALGAAIVAGTLLSRYSALGFLWITFIADVSAALVIFMCSILFDNISLYDPYWSVQPIALVLCWVWITPGTVTVRQVLILCCVSFWGIRLTVHWIRGWKGLNHEDWRYTQYRDKQPKLFWLIAFVGLEMMPTVLVFLGCVALYPALVINPGGIKVFDGAALLVSSGAALIELIADRQMESFLQHTPRRDALMDQGLWSLSRHPNYFGEVSFWWGLYLFALAAAPSWWWTAAGPVAITLLFLFVSIPLLEKRQIARRPRYTAYRKRVSVFIPWFPQN